MKRINVQGDVESRDRISREVKPVGKRNAEPTQVVENAESETVPEPADDQSAEADGQAKKGKRTAKGNV